jgi:putative phosphoesterase
MRIGVIADTHGLVHPAVAEVFARVDHIVHAGDIGGSHVLDALRTLAPLTSVDGNNDDATGEEIERVTIGGARVLLTHILPRPRKPAARVVASLKKQAADFVIFGHSHLPHHETIESVVYFNPASAGPRRFDLPASVGLIEKRGRGWHAYHVALDERSVEALKKRMNQLSR